MFSFFSSGTVIAVVESLQLQLIIVNVGLELPLMQNLEVMLIYITEVFSELSLRYFNFHYLTFMCYKHVFQEEIEV